MQHCTDLPRQVTFAAHTEQKKDGSRVGMNATAHQEKEKNEETKTGMEKGRRSILEKLHAALLRSSRGQHGKKMV